LVRHISDYCRGNMEERTESWLLASTLVFRRFVPGELTADYARDRAVYGTQSRKPVDSENVSNIDS
jgi:hypothetical protein